MISTSFSSDGSNTILSNIDRTRTSFFEHRTNSNMFICWWSNSNTLFLASNERTSNIEPNRAFARFTKLLIELTRTSFFRTSNKLERVHLLVIEFEHPIFGFERSNIKHRTSNFALWVILPKVWVIHHFPPTSWLNNFFVVYMMMLYKRFSLLSA